MPVTSEQIIDALRPVEDPELHRSIVDLEMVRDVRIGDDGTVDVLIALTVPGCPLKSEIQRRVDTAVVALDGVSRVGVEFTVMTDQEREKLRMSLHGDPGATAGQSPAHGHSQGRVIPFARPESRTRPLFISSGKGGVGKSSVTANLAVALAAQGHTVGVLDADIYGYSIPRMLGAHQEPTVIDQMLLPPEAWGVRVMSIGYFVPEGEAVVWRGPMLHKALEQFLTDVFWDEPDFLLVDMPPGTGDIAISLSQYLPRGEVFVVTTPQAGGPGGRPSVGGDGQEGQPAGPGRDREHVVVHGRRRHALRAVRTGRRRQAGGRARRAAVGADPAGAAAPRRR